MPPNSKQECPDETLIVKDTVPFEVEGRLIQELGERLLESADVAIVELIKNAYDADARKCFVQLSDGGDSLVIRDDGVGMTVEQFRTRWMRIATGGKGRDRKSQVFKRVMTGSKGVGRFAVRYLGDHLILDSIAIARDDKNDPLEDENGRPIKRRIVARFEWSELEKSERLDKRSIPYTLTQVSHDTDTGTTLRISALRPAARDFSGGEVTKRTLQITSPSGLLERGHMARKKEEGDTFETFIQDESSGNVNKVGDEILEAAWATLRIQARGGSLKYSVKFRNDAAFDRTKVVPFKLSFPKGFFADIRFYPRRQGSLSGLSLGAKGASAWIRENGGVGIVDHGFRMKPYGFQDDDWLHLNADHGLNRRDWRSSFMKRYFPVPVDAKNRPAFNPALYLPAAHQLLGAVFVESSPSGSAATQRGLIPAMDRIGFVDNGAFKELHDAIRGGIEFLGYLDAKAQEKKQQERLKELAAEARRNIGKAIARIDKIPTLSEADKRAIVSTYVELSKRVDDIETYHSSLKFNLDQMSLLGAVAGFMTHECNRIVYNLKRCLERLEEIGESDEKIRGAANAVRVSLQEFEEHVDYTATFTYAVQKGTAIRFTVEPQIRRVLSKFDRFADEREIIRTIEVDSDLKGPEIPVTVYSGILLNLYSNALKAVVSPENKTKGVGKILVTASNLEDMHVLRVIDNGVGIADELRERIWDPLFTTTSRINNPLGSGMGLGLALVKRLVTDLGGRITVSDALKPFVTQFTVEIPIEP